MPATPAWPPRSAPRLFVPAPLTSGGAVTVEGNQAHYLARVMRVGQGDAVILCDDLTGEWAARVASAMGGAKVLERPDTSRYLDVTVLIGADWRPPVQPFHP